jgi:putative salt-induced outer membrane protein
MVPVMKKRYYALTMAWLMIASVSVNAEEEKPPLTASAEFGFIRTTGNTENQTTTLKGDIVYEVEKWRHTGHVEGYGQEAKDDQGDSVVSAERYAASGKSDYKFTEHDYVYGLVELQKDRFSGFDYDHIVSVGYGRKVIKQENMELDLEIGPGERFYRVENSTADEEAILRLAANYWWQITDTSKFIQDISTDIGEEITSTESVTSIQANINSTLALKFTYTIRHKSKVPDDKEKKDTEVAMTLVYTY